MKIAGIQFPVSNCDVARNLDWVIRGIEQAKECGAQILVTPEGALSGYTHRFDRAEVQEALQETAGAAGKAGVGLALGCCYEESGACYNQLRLYDRKGSLLGAHAKILNCCDPNDITQGEYLHYATTPLRVFCFEGITVGCLVCNDLWANPEWTPQPDPHLSRQLARMGARIIFHGVNCQASGKKGNTYDDTVRAFHENNLKIRAHGDGLWIVSVNSCSEDAPAASTSGVVSPQGEYVASVKPDIPDFFSYDIPLE